MVDLDQILGVCHPVQWFPLLALLPNFTKYKQRLIAGLGMSVKEKVGPGTIHALSS